MWLRRTLLPESRYIAIAMAIALHFSWAMFLLFDNRDSMFLNAMHTVFGTVPTISTVPAAYVAAAILFTVAALAHYGIVGEQLTAMQRVSLFAPQQVLLLWGTFGTVVSTLAQPGSNTSVTWGFVDIPLLLVTGAHMIAVIRVARDD